MPTNDLTMDKLLAVLRKFPPPEPSIFDPIYKPQTFAGMKVFERAQPGPKLQLRELTLSDDTPLVSKEFRDEYNAWLLERFGFRPDPFGDKMFLISGMGLSVSPMHAAMITNLTA